MQIKIIIAAVILFIMASTSYLSYRFYGQIKVLENQVVTLNEDLTKSLKNTELVKQSCTISESISSEVSKIETDMGQQSAKLLEQLSTVYAKEVAHKGAENEQTTSERDDVSADVELQRLLDNAYCTAAASDPYCTTR